VVRIDRRDRPVKFARFVSFDAGQSAGAAASRGSAGRVEPDRLYVLAFDEASFRPADARVAAQATRHFIDSLNPTDYVALFKFPITGPQMELTQNHASVEIKLDGIVGGYQQMRREFDLLPSEIVDLTADDRLVLDQIVRRECSPFDQECPRRIVRQAMDEAGFAEAEAEMRLGAIADLFASLATLPGRKTVLIASGGLFDADRAAGRPDLSAPLTEIARIAARSNTAVYVLHHDSSFFASLERSPRRAAAPGDTPLFAKTFRDGEINANGLEQLAAMTGGSYYKVEAGTPAQAFAQILRETGGFYVLAVEAIDGERDGGLHDVRISVDDDDATVRSQKQIVIPRRISG
jgi:VWFA-related protein